MQYSDNGWPGIDRADTVVVNVPGTDLHLRMAPDAAWMLATFAGRFHAEVESLTGGQLDDWGYAWRNVRGSTTHLSCHASGTAIDLNALMHFRGIRGTFESRKLKRLRELLDEFDGLIKWGGDFRSPSIVDEMHFQIRGNAADLRAFRRKYEEVNVAPFRDRHVLTEADVAAYGNDGLEPGEDSKSYDEIVRFPPAVARLRRELNEKLDALAKAIEELKQK